MSSTFEIRRELLKIARADVDKVESGKNQGEWIKKLWPATNYPSGYVEHAPYCAAGVCYCVREWLRLHMAHAALGFGSFDEAERWRCKSPAAFGWLEWAKLPVNVERGVRVLNPNAILHAGDLVIYSFSHIEIVADDDGTPEGPFVAIGYNTNAAGSRDGEGCFEKPRHRGGVKSFIRLLA